MSFLLPLPKTELKESEDEKKRDI